MIPSTHGGRSVDLDDKQKRALYAASQLRSVGLAYILLIWTGFFGGHRFYVGDKGIAIAQIVFSILTVGIVTFLWLLIDLFLIGDRVRDFNRRLIEEA